MAADTGFVDALRLSYNIRRVWQVPEWPLPGLRVKPDAETLAWCLLLADALCPPDRPPEWVRIVKSHLAVTNRALWESAFHAALEARDWARNPYSQYYRHLNQAPSPVPTPR